MSEIPEIPEVLLLEGVTAGLSEDETARAWKKYCTWSLKNYPHHDLGGRSWTQHIAKAMAWKAEDEAGQNFVKAERAADRARKVAAEEAAYAREACTFGQWVHGLVARVARGETIPVWEQLLVRWATENPAGGVQQFMGWYALQMDRVKATKQTVYVPPEEQRRSDLEYLEAFDEGGGVT